MLRTIAGRLFTLPGGPLSESDLLQQAATAHQHLFQQACSQNPELCASLPALHAQLRGCRPPPEDQRLLCHPSFVEGLHRLTRGCPGLQTWHNAVASPSAAEVAYQRCEDCGPLGTMELALRMHAGSEWLHPLRLTSDMFGCLHFPHSDWEIALHATHAGGECVLSDEPVEVRSEGDIVRWQWERDEAPFLVLPREVCRQIVDGDDAGLGSCPGRGLSTRVAAQIYRARPLCPRGARYEGLHIADAEHAETTEDIVRGLHAAFEVNSPRMHREFCALISAVRGLDLPLNSARNLQSYSDPSCPGVLTFNVPYDARHEPHLSPLCFTWLAHELAHTKCYLINDVAFDHGWQFVENGAEMTDVVPRYGRQLPIRTLFQIPYTHIYEWEVLMDFVTRDFAGMPWLLDEDPYEYGEDLKREIEEAFVLSAQAAELTSLGNAAFAQFTELYDRSLLRWRELAG